MPAYLLSIPQSYGLRTERSGAGEARGDAQAAEGRRTIRPMGQMGPMRPIGRCRSVGSRGPEEHAEGVEVRRVSALALSAGEEGERGAGEEGAGAGLGDEGGEIAVRVEGNCVE